MQGLRGWARGGVLDKDSEYMLKVAKAYEIYVPFVVEG